MVRILTKLPYLWEVEGYVESVKITGELTCIIESGTPFRCTFFTDELGDSFIITYFDAEGPLCNVENK